MEFVVKLVNMLWVLGGNVWLSEGFLGIYKPTRLLNSETSEYKKIVKLKKHIFKVKRSRVM